MNHAVLVFATLLCAAQLTHVRAEEIGPDALVGLPAADVVILGEIHDNPHHHANQARAVAALAPKALVFEMLDPAKAAAITPESHESEQELRRVLDWDNSGWPDFALYYPIFAAAASAQIYAGDLPPGDARRAVSEGARAVFGVDAAKYGLDTPLSEEQQAAREAEQMSAHCDALPEAMLPGMVEAQRLRDAVLAQAVVRAIEATGGSVVVITGSGHARTDWGVPAVLSIAAPQISVLSLGQLESPPTAPVPYDLWIVTPPTPREDPCAGFAVKE